MKKFLLSVGVILAFVIYAVIERLGWLGGVNRQVVVTAKLPAGTTPTTTSAKVILSSRYKDGRYTGQVADAFYGNLQVAAVVKNGQLAEVQFLQYPNDRATSIEVNTAAMPQLRQEAIRIQSAQVDTVSGATDTSSAFRQSLGDALMQAQTG